MVFKKVALALLAAISIKGSLFGFTIINQTDTEKVMRLQEAYRPQADESGNLPAPKPVSDDSCEITIPANSAYTIDLHCCPVLLVDIVTVKKTKNRVSTSTSTTCYEPLKKI